jgi:hypothetical protein
MICIGVIDVLKVRKGLWRAMTMEKGPSCVLFQIFFMFLNTNRCFIAYTGFTLRNTRQRDRWKQVTTEKGPNDASGIVWALGECFF